MNLSQQRTTSGKPRAGENGVLFPGAPWPHIAIAAVQTVGTAVISALIANETRVGRDGHRATVSHQDELRELLKRYGRLKDSCDVG